MARLVRRGWQGFLTYETCAWGSQACVGMEECPGYAELLYDGQPLCIRCADLLLERHVAISETPQIAQQLPALWDFTTDAVRVARNRR